MKSILILLAFLLCAQSAHAHGGGGEGAPNIGKGIIAYDKHSGFELSPQALSRMKFAYKKVEANGSLTLPREAVVYALKDVHIYVRTNEFFKAVDVKVISKSKDIVTVSSPAVKAGVEVVVKGVSFLRVIDMDLGGGVEDEHSDEHGDEHGEHADEHGEGEHHD